MKWSVRIGRLAGIDVYVHATFLLLIGWVALSYWLSERNVTAVVAGVTFILALFGCVVLHELGHALAARRYGVATRDITLWPIGGVAKLERIPEEPRQELVVALAGPAVNVVISALLFAVVAASPGPLHLSFSGEDLLHASFLERLLVVNLFLAGFNLLPAFPMDGGRVLRALLATHLNHTRATEVAAHVGQGMALLFGFVGLFTNPFLVFIALFVWLGAAGEGAMVQMQSAFSGIPVARAMITDFVTLGPRDSLAHAVETTLAGTQTDFPVVEEGRVIGVLRQSDLLKGLSRQGPEAPVEGYMCRRFERVDPYALLDRVFVQLHQSECQTLPVVHGDRLVGLLTPANIGEFVRIQSALAGSRPRGRRTGPTRVF